MNSSNISEVFKIMNMKEHLEKREAEFFKKYGTRILVDEAVKEKVQIVCNAIKDIFGGDYEWIGYLLGDRDYIARDFYIPYQEIFKAFVSEDRELAGKNLIELEKMMEKTNLKLIGWIHSHGSMSPFHSDTDDENTYALVRFIGMHTKRSILKLDDTPKRIKRVSWRNEEIILEGDKTIIIGKLDIPESLADILFNRKIIRSRNKSQIAGIIAILLNYIDWWFFKRKWVAPVFSIVTNSRLEFYGEIWKFDSENTPIRISKGRIIDFVESKKEVKWDKEAIYAEVRRKMRLGGI